MPSNKLAHPITKGRHTRNILCDPVRFHNPFRAIKGVLGKLFDIRLPRNVVYNGVFVGIFCLGLGEFFALDPCHKAQCS